MSRPSLAVALALVLAPLAARAVTVLDDGRLQIAFTTPGVSAETGADSDADDAVIALIQGATATIDACLYDFNHAGLVDALTAAADRGVEVRFVGDADEADQAGYAAMDSAGIPTALRVGGAIMHNKFVVIDGRFVATGSMNYSDACVLRNNNNVVLIDDAVLASAYAAEFAQMFVDGSFGRDKVAHAHPPVDLGQTRVQVAFSPADDPELVLRAALASADHSVYFMVFSFTHPDVAADLIAAHDAGVEVVGVYDRFGASGAYSTDEDLAAAGLPVLLDGNEHQIGSSGGKLHHKVMIIDGGTASDPTVITGSFNWSAAASADNDENLVVLRGAEAVAPFMAEFCEVFDAALPHPDAPGPLPDPCQGLPDPAQPRLVLNELLPSPSAGGPAETYVEIVNASPDAIDLAGWRLGDPTHPARHVFASGTLAPGEAVVVFGAPSATAPHRVVASSGDLGLGAAPAPLTLYAPAGLAEDTVTPLPAAVGRAQNRAQDGVGGALVDHAALAPDGALGSPGLRVDGTPWVVVGAPRVFINEVLPNPAGTDLGQEYVEVVNMGPSRVNLGGWRLGDVASPSRHVFAVGTLLEPGEAVVVFDRGDHPSVPNSVNATTELLSLNNTAETVTLYDERGAVIDAASWSTASDGVALNRAVDGGAEAPLVPHDLVQGAVGLSSPGLRADQSAWGAAPPATDPPATDPPATDPPATDPPAPEPPAPDPPAPDPPAPNPPAPDPPAPVATGRTRSVASAMAPSAAPPGPAHLWKVPRRPRP